MGFKASLDILKTLPNNQRIGSSDESAFRESLWEEILVNSWADFIITRLLPRMKLVRIPLILDLNQIEARPVRYE